MNENWKQELKEYKQTEFIRTDHFCLSCTFRAIGLDLIIGIANPLLYIRFLFFEVRFF